MLVEFDATNNQNECPSFSPQSLLLPLPPLLQPPPLFLVTVNHILTPPLFYPTFTGVPVHDFHNNNIHRVFIHAPTFMHPHTALLN